jgi:CO/xanthine dehydrogenase FAD-binding subunit
VRSGFGARETPLEEFLSGRDRLGSVLVLSVAFQRPPTPDAFRWRKVSSVKPKGASVLSIAACLPQSGGRVQGARIAFGAMGPTPLRAKGAERALEGRSLDGADIQAAVQAALEGTNPADDAIASAWYRREVAGAHLRRVLAGEA